MNAKLHDLKRIFFGGFFIRGHPYTMDTISWGVRAVGTREHVLLGMPCCGLCTTRTTAQII